MRLWSMCFLAVFDLFKKLSTALCIFLTISCYVYRPLVDVEFLIWKHFNTKILSWNAYSCFCLLEFTFTSQENVKMSSRRKRALPVKVDEEKQQQLRWNMHEDRRNEPLTILDDEHPCPGSDSSSADCIILDDSLNEEVAHRDKKKCSEAVSVSKAINKKDTGDSTSPLSVKLSIVISPYHFDNSWKAFLGELTLQLLPQQSLSENFSERSFTLMSVESSSQFLICVHTECIDVEKQEKGLNEPISICDKGIRVESSFSSEMLEDLGWLQKKRRIKLYQKPEGNHIIKVLNICSVF